MIVRCPKIEVHSLASSTEYLVTNDRLHTVQMLAAISDSHLRRTLAMSVNVLQEAFEAMERASSSVELRVEMEHFSRQMGFEKFAYALTINAPSLKPQQYTISGYPNEWTD